MNCCKDEKPVGLTKMQRVGALPLAPRLKCQGNCERCRKKKENRKSKGLTKAILLVAGLLFGHLNASAQAPMAKSFWDDPIHHPLFPFYFVCFFVFVVILLTLAVAVVMLRVLRIFTTKMAEEKAEKLGIAYVTPESWWSKFWLKANALVPLQQEKSIELDHNYDGIRELDNHLPPWWKGLFYGSIVFAVVYMVLYHISATLPLSEQEYMNEVSAAQEQARMLKASQPAEVIDLNKIRFAKDEVLISRGKAVFTSSNCQSCHRNDGGGNTIGPNLTDAYWLHGGGLKNIFSTINHGVVEKAMPAWGKVMSQKDVLSLAFYVMSIQGTNPPNAKAPQGALFKPMQDSVAHDTIKVQAMLKVSKK